MMGQMMNNGYYGGDWSQMPEQMRQMMQNYGGGFSPFGSWFGLLHFITWVLVIALLAGLVRWVWKKGDKVK